ncbi:MAG: hypothetical protein ACOYOB_14905 [Myxococcota bacterium]
MKTSACLLILGVMGIAACQTDCGTAETRKRIDSLAASLNDCTADAQCVVVSDATPCNAGCGVAIHVQNKAAFSSGLASIVADICTTCSGAVAASCVAPAPACVGGTCRYSKAY